MSDISLVNPFQLIDIMHEAGRRVGFTAEAGMQVVRSRFPGEGIYMPATLGTADDLEWDMSAGPIGNIRRRAIAEINVYSRRNADGTLPAYENREWVIKMYVGEPFTELLGEHVKAEESVTECTLTAAERADPLAARAKFADFVRDKLQTFPAQVATVKQVVFVNPLDDLDI